MQDIKLADQTAGQENTGHEIAGHEKARQCKVQNLYSLLYTWNYCLGSSKETVAQKMECYL